MRSMWFGLHEGQQIDHMCKHMTFGITLLINIFPLHTKNVNKFMTLAINMIDNI